MSEDLINIILGLPGRTLLDFVKTNKTSFASLVFLYAALTIYSKYILNYYLPGQLQKVIANELLLLEGSGVEETVLVEKIYVSWVARVEQFPWYIVMPGKNEYWVQRPQASYTDVRLLPYERAKKKKMPKEIIHQKVQFYQKERKGVMI
jgi:hypothetical protein